MGKISEEQLDQLAMDCVVMLHAHEALGRLMNGEKIKECPVNDAVKKMMADDAGDTPQPVIHAVMLANELEALNAKYDWFHCDIDRNKPETLMPLLGISKRLMLVRYESEEASRDVEGIDDEFISFLCDLIKSGLDE